MQIWTALLEEEEEEDILAVWKLSALVLLRCFTAPLGVLLVMKTLENTYVRYVVIKAYKFTFFEIFVLSHIAFPCYPYIRVYRFYDKYQIDKD